MKRLKFTLKVLNLIVITSLALQLQAQQDVAQFLQGNLNDAKKLGEAYLAPFGKMFGSSMNGGWYQAARPHKLFGFNVSFVTTVVTVPSDAKTFDVNKLNLQNLRLETGANPMSPTVSGATTNGPRLVYNGSPSVGFNLPKGANLPFTPMPIFQAGLGLPFHSEITFRYLPAVKVPKVGELSSWGVGVKNEFKEFIPGLKLVPIDLSLFVGYSQFNSQFDVSFKPGYYDPGQPNQASAFNNQKLELTAKGYTARILVGKTIPFFSAYVGLGYNHAVSEFGLKGLYPIGIHPTHGTTTNISPVNNPFTLSYTHSGFAGNIGFRLRFGVFAINADYTLGKYPLYTAGLGISFR